MGWLGRLVTRLLGPPGFVIGDTGNPYLLRWYLIPRNKIFNLYLHKFLRDDDDRALHDHPWWFISVILRGRYTEITPNGSIGRTCLSVAFRRAEHKHRVVLPRDTDGKSIPCWSLLITGRVSRDWGFWCPRGWVHYKDFIKPTPGGNSTGRGCE